MKKHVLNIAESGIRNICRELNIELNSTQSIGCLGYTMSGGAK